VLLKFKRKAFEYLHFARNLLGCVGLINSNNDSKCRRAELERTGQMGFFLDAEA